MSLEKTKFSKKMPQHRYIYICCFSIKFIVQQIPSNCDRVCHAFYARRNAIISLILKRWVLFLFYLCANVVLSFVFSQKILLPLCLCIAVLYIPYMHCISVLFISHFIYLIITFQMLHGIVTLNTCHNTYVTHLRECGESGECSFYF